ncbi:hypothetical protein LIP_2936 [Limnochorda pilosa]|uniref:DUF1614 domain-containing protein n=1 Tax=Limnochorda pilosa TaxID=1555112 RepID=A0A0K2SNS6_LIMPI|nr:hypothetical protein LIP_2936 [Limnochorda pilosa]
MSMFFFPFWFLLLLLAPLWLMLIYFNLIATSFAALGLSPEAAFWLLVAVVLGSAVNIPIWRERVVQPGRARRLGFLLFYSEPPVVSERVLAVNLGGAVIPVLLALYLLQRAPLGPSLAGAAVMTVLAKALARPIYGRGIAMPLLLPPLAAAVLGIMLGGQNAAPVAYVSGVLGTLVGADLLNLGRIRTLGAQVVSIGGAGVRDGIFLVGMVAALIPAL